MQSPDVLRHRVLFLRVAAAALNGTVERAQAVNLHPLRVEQHLNQARAELLQHAEHHVGGVDAAVVGNVAGQLARVD